MTVRIVYRNSRQIKVVCGLVSATGLSILLNVDYQLLKSSFTPYTYSAAVVSKVHEHDKAAYIDLRKSQLFGVLNQKSLLPKATLKPPPDTRLQLTLHGIFGSTEGSTSSALISDTNGYTNRFFIGDEIQNGIFLDSVNTESVVISRSGKTELLKFSRAMEKGSIDLPERINSSKRNGAKKSASTGRARKTPTEEDMLNLNKHPPQPKLDTLTPIRTP